MKPDHRNPGQEPPELEDPTAENSRLRLRIAELEACEEKWRQTEESYNRLEERLNFSIEGGELGIWELDLATDTAWRSLRHDMIFGYDSLLPDWGYDIFMGHVHPDDRASVDVRFRKAIETGSIWEFECRIIRKDGVVRWIWAQGKTLSNERGEPVKIYGMVRDITERKEAEEKAREIYQLYRIIFENSEDGLLLTAPDGRILDANPAASMITGYSREEIISIGRAGLLDTTDPRLNEYLNRRSSEGFATGELTLRRKDGSTIPIEVSSRIFFEERGEKRTSIVFRDISRRLETEKELKQHRDNLEELVKERTEQLAESHRTLKALIDNMVDEVWFSDENGNLVMVNRAAREAFGLESHEGRRAPESIESREAQQIELNDLLSLIEIYDMDGKPRTPENAPMTRSLRGETVRGEEISYNPRTGRKNYREFSSAPIRDGNGRVTGVVAVVRDVEDRKKLEEELRSKAIELQRSLSEIELFAYAASHDLREPLRKFTVFIDRLRNEFGPMLDARGLDYLRRMENAAVRMREMIDGILELSKVSAKAASLGQVDLAVIIREVQSDMEVLISETGALIEVGPMPVMEADALQMRQLFQNLISNAIKFRKDAPRITITSRPVEKMHEITVRDNGIGFDEKYLDIMFKPFQQLHDRGVYEGVGMGLAICSRIVGCHHGAITARNAPGGGSLFIVSLPANQSAFE